MIGNMSTPPANWDARKGNIVRKRRQALDLEQRDLADRVGVHVNSVQRWEAGTQYPGRKLGKLEDVLGVRLDDEPVGPETATPEEIEDLVAHVVEVLGPDSRLEQAIRDVTSGRASPRRPRGAPASGQSGSRLREA